MVPLMATVTFLPLGVRGDLAPDESLFELGRRLEVPIATACVGKGTCGLCRVKVLSGEDTLTPVNETERRHLGNVYFLTKRRLSCQMRAANPAGEAIVVELPIGDRR
jgi:ferredoxin